MTPPDRARPSRIEQHYAQSAFVGELCVVATAPPSPTVRLDNGRDSLWHALVVADAAYLRSQRIVGVTDWIRFEFETLSEALDPADRLNSVIVALRPLPRTAAGDVDREAVAALLAAGARTGDADEASAQAALVADDDVGACVVALAARASGRPSWPGAHLDVDLGLDSIGRLELVLAVEDALGVTIAGAPGLATVGELIDAARHAPARPRATDAATPWHALLAPPAPPAADGAAGLAPRPWAVSVATYLLLLVIRLVATLAVGLRVEGLAHVPRRGPMLLCPNHDTLVDGFLVSAVLPLRTWHRLFFVGASEYYATRASAWFARAIGIVPIDADANLPGALRAAAAALRAGRALLIFPEGERSIDGQLKRFRPGAALLATTLGVPVVPVHLQGAFAWWPRGHGFAWRRLWRRGPRVRLRFGPPLVAGCDGAPPDAAGFAAALRDRVSRLALPGSDGQT